MTLTEILCVIGGILILIGIKGVYDNRSNKIKLRKKLKREFGQLPKTDYKLPRYGGIKYYHNHKKHTGDVVDDITWNDLDMESVFMAVNNTCTGVGEESLYSILRSPVYEETELNERERLIDFFAKDQKKRLDIQCQLKQLGKIKSVCVHEYMDSLRHLKYPAIPWDSILLSGGFILSIILTFFYTEVFLMVDFGFVLVNTVVSFRKKASIKGYFSVFSYTVRMVNAAKVLAKQDIPELDAYRDALRRGARPLEALKVGDHLMTTGDDLNGSILSFIMDYLNMVFHVDLILFSRMLSILQKHEEDLDILMENIGYLDSMIAIASYRAFMKDSGYCLPELMEQSKSLETEEIYHPLIVDPVKNSIRENQSVLLTGSNASGKSTFLKTIAINAILAQTIHTVLADSYRGGYFRIYSSMALTDNLFNNESYYIVEIKSLKRIMDALAGDTPVLCFIDEVLRGTNTLERIAASSQILAEISRGNALCFAATHDIELTSILEKDYSNYHFQEEIVDNEIVFDYKLYSGRAVTRNAIKLLGIIGFGQEIIDKANVSCSGFERTGVWEILNVE